MAGNIQCVKCGLEAFGKCPKCRTIFPIKDEYEMTTREKECDHVWEYVEANLQCIYGCGYRSKRLLAFE